MPGLLTEASVEQLQDAEERMVEELRNRARSQISGVGSDAMVHVRDVLPDEDLVSGADNSWSGSTREWVQDSLNTGENTVYEIDSSDKAEGKVIGIFAVSFVSDSPVVTEITFEDGTGSRFERLMVQEATTYTEGQYALMRNPIIFDEGKDGSIHFWSPAGTGAAGDEVDNIILHGAVAEKAGTTLGTRSQGEQAATGTARRPQ